jgi:hypothetical protein
MNNPITIDIGYWGDHTLLGWVMINMLDQVLKPEKLHGLTFIVKYKHAHPNPAEVQRQLMWMSDHGAVIVGIVHVQD